MRSFLLLAAVMAWSADALLIAKAPGAVVAAPTMAMSPAVRAASPVMMAAKAKKVAKKPKKVVKKVAKKPKKAAKTAIARKGAPIDPAFDPAQIGKAIGLIKEVGANFGGRTSGGQGGGIPLAGIAGVGVWILFVLRFTIFYGAFGGE